MNRSSFHAPSPNSTPLKNRCSIARRLRQFTNKSSASSGLKNDRYSTSVQSSREYPTLINSSTSSLKRGGTAFHKAAYSK
jgi:hypothetical protein